MTQTTSTSGSATAPDVLIQYDIIPNISELERQIAEHQRRQAIENVRFWDRVLYGRSDKTIPKRTR